MVRRDARSWSNGIQTAPLKAPAAPTTGKGTECINDKKGFRLSFEIETNWWRRQILVNVIVLI